MIRCQYCNRVCWLWQSIGRNKSGFAHTRCATAALTASLDAMRILGINTQRWEQ